MIDKKLHPECETSNGVMVVDKQYELSYECEGRIISLLKKHFSESSRYKNIKGNYIKLSLLSIGGIVDENIFRALGWKQVGIENTNKSCANPFDLCFSIENNKIKINTKEQCHKRNLKLVMELILEGTDHRYS